MKLKGIILIVILLLLTVSITSAELIEYPYYDATANLGAGSVGKLFDHSLATYWDAPGTYSVNKSGGWARQNYGIGVSHVINEYGVYIGTWNSNAPRMWWVEASNDNTNWALLDYRSEQTGWSQNAWRNFTFPNSNAYQYYRLNVTQLVDGATGALVINEWSLICNTSAVAPVVANFSLNSTGGIAPISVALTDTSTGSPTAWNYTAYNTGNSTEFILSTLQNPTLTFQNEGNYSIRSNVSNVGGFNKSALYAPNHWVNVSSQKITADFTSSNSTGIRPLIVKFTDTSTTISATIDSWYWDFGDGNTSTSQSPLHTYEIPGAYSANMTITNTSLSLVSTKLATITVYKQPVCDFSSFNTQGTAPFTTRLFDTSTNLNTGPYTYYTDFGDGNTSTEEALYYNWNITGTYDVKHCITDSVTTACNNKTAYVTVGTAVDAPVASFYGGPQLGAPPLKVFFTDVSSNTPTGWFWEFGDGTNSTSQNPEHYFNRSGFYTVNLTVANTAGSNMTTQKNFIMVY